MELYIPHKYKPRSYQLPVWKARENWIKRVIKVWHRRAWKDRDDRNNMIHKAWKTPWLYFYIFPTQSQARKAIWDWMDANWFRYIDHIPEEITVRKDQQQMKIEMINWSIIQIVGTELWQIDRLVWSNPIWVQFSEYSLSNPRAWDLIRPILAENWWWAWFNYTPRWRNHGYDLFMLAKDNPKREVSLLTVDDTCREDWNPIISKEYLQEELDMWMDYDLWLQEYYCSFDASVQWAYYSSNLKKMDEENRFCSIPYDPALDVHTFWDLWISDATAIIFAQIFGKEVRIIDYLESSWEWMDYYIRQLKDKGYNYWNHYLPHDAEARELTTWVSRVETMRNKWLENIKITPRLWIMDWIDQARAMFQNLWINKDKAEYIYRCLWQYHKEYDEKRKIFKDHPEHDRSSHWADAFRYLAVNYSSLLWIGKKKQVIISQPNRSKSL